MEAGHRNGWKWLAGGIVLIGIVLASQGASASTALMWMAVGALIAGIAMLSRRGLRLQGVGALVAAVILYHLAGNALPTLGAGAGGVLGALVLVAVVGLAVLNMGKSLLKGFWTSPKGEGQ